MGLWTNSTPVNGSLDFIDASAACYSTSDASGLAGVFHRENLPYQSLLLLLLQLSIYIAATRLLRFILKPFHQPAVVSEIIAGILLGPSFAARWGEFGKHLSPPYGMTLTGTCAMVGIAFFIFNEALKQDISHVFNSGRKEMVISLSGCTFAYVFTYMTGSIFAGSFTKEEQPHRADVLFTLLPFLLAPSSFPVLQSILAEFDLLNSELGRLSMTLSLINSVLVSVFVVVGSSLRQARFGALKGVGNFAAQIALLLFITVVLRPIFLLVIRKIPAGRRLPSDYVCFSLLVILGLSFLGEIIGEMTFGIMVMGFAIPPGPPLASAIVEKTEMFNNVVFLPCFYIVNGLHVNVFDIDDWRSFWLLQLVVWAGFLGKFLGTFVPSLYYDMSFQDSLAVAAIMSFNGIMELVYINVWVRHKIVDETKMMALELSLVSTTVITCPLLRCLARRTRGPRTLRSWASMQQSMFGGELRVLVCVYDEEDVPFLCQLLSNTLASRSCPLHVVVLRVAELLGRGLPILVSHLKGAARADGNLHPIFRSFQALERDSEGFVSLHPFTSISPLRTAKDDVYKVAFEKQVSLVIIPFSREEFRSRHETGGAMGKVLARSVLADAPCTVGILANGCGQGRHRSLWASEGEPPYRVGLVYLGGPDDREALAYATRLLKKPNISLLVLRCTGGNENDEETEVDDRLLEEFKFRSLYREHIVYKEAAVMDVEELVSCIKGMGDDFDLLMVGRQHCAYSEIEAALSSWSESTELGAVGDYLVSPDFARSSVSVLVLHRKRKEDGNCERQRKTLMNPYGRLDQGG